MASPPDMKTSQGYEQQLGVNVVGPFLFTKLLLPTMISTAESIKSDPSTPKDYNIVRIINTSSNGHAGAPSGGFKFENPNKLKSKWEAYGQSKWSNIIVAQEIAKKFGNKGITSHSLNPGVIRTELARYSSAIERAFIVSIFFLSSFHLFTLRSLRSSAFFLISFQSKMKREKIPFFSFCSYSPIKHNNILISMRFYRSLLY